jgi:hypothetical protein
MARNSNAPARSKTSHRRRSQTTRSTSHHEQFNPRTNPFARPLRIRDKGSLPCSNSAACVGWRNDDRKIEPRMNWIMVLVTDAATDVNSPGYRPGGYCSPILTLLGYTPSYNLIKYSQRKDPHCPWLETLTITNFLSLTSSHFAHTEPVFTVTNDGPSIANRTSMALPASHLTRVCSVQKETVEA